MPHVTVTPIAPDGTTQKPIDYTNADASQDATTGILTVLCHGRRDDREIAVEFQREQYADWKQTEDPKAPAPPRAPATAAPKAHAPTPSTMAPLHAPVDKEEGR